MKGFVTTETVILSILPILWQVSLSVLPPVSSLLAASCFILLFFTFSSPLHPLLLCCPEEWHQIIIRAPQIRGFRTITVVVIVNLCVLFISLVTFYIKTTDLKTAKVPIKRNRYNTVAHKVGIIPFSDTFLSYSWWNESEITVDQVWLWLHKISQWVPITQVKWMNT